MATSASVSSVSSLAALSQQIEESRAQQLQERSARALELMQTAVEWKSWEELRTLTKAFQCYLQEIRETDQQRKRDFETSLSRVRAARDQLATAKWHKEEATSEADIMTKDNAELRRQLQFDARQFVALLQSCAHLEKQLAVLKQADDCIAEDEGEVAASSPQPEDLEGELAASSQPAKADPGAKFAEATEREGAPVAETAAETTAELMSPEGAPGAAQEPAHSPSEAQPSDVSTALAPSPAASPPATPGPAASKQAASPDVEPQPEAMATEPAITHTDVQKDAIHVLSTLAELKKRLQLCAPRDASISTCDGTPALRDLASPGNTLAEDAEDAASAADTGASRTSEPPHGLSQEPQEPTPQAGPGRQERLQATLASPSDAESSPLLRPSVLAATEAARWAAVKNLPKAPASLRAGMTQEDSEEVARTSRPSRYISYVVRGQVPMALEPITMAAATVCSPRRLTTASDHSPTRPTGAAGTAEPSYARRPVPSAVSAAPQTRRGAWPQDGRSPAGSPVRLGLPNTPESPDKSAQSGQTSQLPAVPPLPQAKLSPQRAGLQEPGPAGKADLQSPRGKPAEARADASYVATIQLVKDLNRGKVPSATSKMPYKKVRQDEARRWQGASQQVRCNASVAGQAVRVHAVCKTHFRWLLGCNAQRHSGRFSAKQKFLSRWSLLPVKLAAPPPKSFLLRCFLRLL
ncbi:unnamed protein product [Effrenium voratum]|nr:unnamed protein product [Effrenium voratum]